MKGKMLNFEEVIRLPEGSKVWVEDLKNFYKPKINIIEICEGITYLNPLEDCENEGRWTIKAMDNDFSRINVFKWIEDNKIVKNYYLDEILKMIREGNLRENVVLISPSQTATGTIDMFGNIPLNKLKEFEPFEIYKEKEYLTFDEAVKTSKNFKYRTWGSYMHLTDVILEIRDIDEDRLEEMFNEKAWEVEN